MLKEAATRKAILPICFAASFLLAACTSPNATMLPALQTEIEVDQAPAPLESLIVPTATDTTIPPTLAALSPEPLAYFKVAVIVDTSSELVTLEQAEAVNAEASDILYRLTGFGIDMVDFIEDSSGASAESMGQKYLAEHADSPPNGLIIYSFGDDNQRAKLYGGYSQWLRAPGDFTNSFVSALHGDREVYVAVIHFSHHYAACGYAGTDNIQSAVSSHGECRGVDGVACVPFNNFQICEDAVDHLYASTPTYFAASVVVHEFLHPFGPAGIDDHYGTQGCNEAMNWPSYYFDFNYAQRYNGICPYIYDLFIDSYQP